MIPRAFRRPVTTLLASGLLAVVTPAQWTAVMLHPSGVFSSECRAVADGQQVGYRSLGASNYQASLWNGSAASMVDLTPPGSTFSDLRDVSNGHQVGVAKFGALDRALLWSGDPNTYVDLTPAGAVSAVGTCVDGGTQGGYARFGSSNHAGLWTGSAASWVDLHPGAPFGESTLLDTKAGQQVGSTNANGFRAALWSGTKASFVDLAPVSPVGDSVAYAVDGGQQVGYVSFSFKPHAALWTGSAASFVDLHPANATYSYATAVSQGVQVGYASLGSIHAVLWHGSAASMEDLHAFLPAGFKSSLANSIWHDGAVTYVAGTAVNSTTNHNEPVLWVSDPQQAWTGQGSSYPGEYGHPALTGAGSLAPNSLNNVALTNARHATLAVLLLSTSSAATPFKGGVLLVAPPIVASTVMTDVDGEVLLAFEMPPGGTSGDEIWAQWAIQDPFALHDVSLSNAIRGVLP